MFNFDLDHRKKKWTEGWVSVDVGFGFYCSPLKNQECSLSLKFTCIFFFFQVASSNLVLHYLQYKGCWQRWPRPVQVELLTTMRPVWVLWFLTQAQVIYLIKQLFILQVLPYRSLLGPLFPVKNRFSQCHLEIYHVFRINIFLVVVSEYGDKDVSVYNYTPTKASYQFPWVELFCKNFDDWMILSFCVICALSKEWGIDFSSGNRLLILSYFFWNIITWIKMLGLEAHQLVMSPQGLMGFSSIVFWPYMFKSSIRSDCL